MCFHFCFLIVMRRAKGNYDAHEPTKLISLIYTLKKPYLQRKKWTLDRIKAMNDNKILISSFVLRLCSNLKLVHIIYFVLN